MHFLNWNNPSVRTLLRGKCISKHSSGMKIKLLCIQSGMSSYTNVSLKITKGLIRPLSEMVLTKCRSPEETKRSHGMRLIKGCIQFWCFNRVGEDGINTMFKACNCLVQKIGPWDLS